MRVSVWQVDRAYKRGSTDNITVVVISLKENDQHKSFLSSARAGGLAAVPDEAEE